jgi:hypothetical protein
MKKMSFFVLLAFVFGFAFVTNVVAEEHDCPTLETGDIFKVEGHSAVYMLDDNLNRLYFPHADVFKSWFNDYSEVVEISETCVDAYPAPLDPPFGVNYRPGSRLVKVKISPSVYAIEPGNKLRKIDSEAVARQLYGDNWASLVRDISDAFWPNFKNRGQALKEGKPHDGMFLSTPRLDGVYLVENGVLKKIEDTSTINEEDVRVVNWGVFAKLRLKSGIVKAKRAFIKAHQRHRDGGSDDEEIEEEDEEELEVLDEDVVDNSKVSVCHKPRRSSGKAKTINVSIHALNAHLSHGDTEGECGSSDDDGDDDTTDDDGDDDTTTTSTAPVISDLSVTVSSTTVTFTWKTDKSVSSTVHYGTSTSTYDFSVDATSEEEDDGTFTHTVELTDLQAGNYRYKVESTDPSDNTAEETGDFDVE